VIKHFCDLCGRELRPIEHTGKLQGYIDDNMLSALFYRKGNNEPMEVCHECILSGIIKLVGVRRS
jgi:hypothetical protein